MLTLLVSSDAQAVRIYKSIDAAGNVTYSSTPPDDASQIEKIIVPAESDADANTADNIIIDQIRAAADELEQDRKLREAERETARKNVLAEEAVNQAKKPPEPVIQYYPVYPPGYFRPERRRPSHSHQPPPRPPRSHPPEEKPLPEKPGQGEVLAQH